MRKSTQVPVAAVPTPTVANGEDNSLVQAFEKDATPTSEVEESLPSSNASAPSSSSPLAAETVAADAAPTPVEPTAGRNVDEKATLE